MSTINGILNTMNRLLRRLRKSGQLPIINFEQLFPNFNYAKINLESVSERYGGVRLIELIYLSYLASHKKDARIFEIGTGEGRTTLNLAINLIGDGHVFSLDLPTNYLANPSSTVYTAQQERLEVQAFKKGMLVCGKELPCTLLEGESTTFDFSPWYKSIDIVFIDGGHTHRAIECDTNNAFELLKPSGGIILWHDYLYNSCPDVFNFLNQLGHKYPLRLISNTKTVIYTSDPDIRSCTST